jgi:hypothetical protein
MRYMHFVIYVVLTTSGLSRDVYQQNDGQTLKLENMPGGASRPQGPQYIIKDTLRATTKERYVQIVMGT